jgi:creatinine amidohydrolase/Fe(II)-dependent formamide hydrolase-like protein
MRRSLSLILLVAVVALMGAKPTPESPDPNMIRPIDALDSVYIEEMTWLEVRDAMKAGKHTVIIATGGVEQNGPYLATGKHNYVLKGITEVIARKLGTALVAPIIAFVPEGDIDPPTGHMRYPGTISLTEETYARLLTDICSSFKTHGFAHIVLIGDSGGNQKGMKDVAAALNAKWKDSKTKVHYVPEYYNFPAVNKWVEEQGIKQEPEGWHDDIVMTAMLMAVDPTLVRMKQRQAVNKFRINGVDLDQEKTAELGRKIISFRAEATIKAIRQVTGGK